MRPIKFRGERVDTGEWVYGDLNHGKGISTTGLYDRITIAGYQVDGETVGQFTGLYDCEKEEIYENDILSIAGMYYQIIFQDGCFGFKNDWSLFTPFSTSFLTKRKVMGNVYDNPELLEGGEK